MSGPRFFYPSFAQRNPISLVLLALAPLTLSLSLATVARAHEKASVASSGSDEDQAVQERKTQATPLSVAPMDIVEYPEDRPEWIEAVDDGEGLAHRSVAVSEPSESIEESLASLEMMKRIAVRLYANRLILADGHHDPFALDEAWVRDNIDRFVTRQYQGTLRRGETVFHEHAAELEFNPKVREEIRLQWKNTEVRSRLGALGFLVFVAVVLTGCGSAALGIFSRRIERRNAVN